jgi:hypothetical protein
MTRPETTGTAAPAQSAWRLQLGRVAIGIAAAAVLFLLGWMMGRGPAADLEQERDEARTRVAILSAEAAAYRSAVALEARNFGTANDHLRRAAVALATIPPGDEVPGLSEAGVAALDEVRTALSATDLNVAVDVEMQRATVLRLAGRLDEIAAASEPVPATPEPASAAPTDPGTTPAVPADSAR